MAKFTPPSDREHPPTGSKGCIGGVHSPGPATNTDIGAASNGSQPVTRDQTGNRAPPKK